MRKCYIAFAIVTLVLTADSLFMQPTGNQFWFTRVCIILSGGFTFILYSLYQIYKKIKP
jgi:hypothetical protein